MAITPLPTAPSRSDPGNFTARADAFMTALPTFANEANALQTDVNEKQVTANAAADTATTQATNASASSAAAAISANNAAASTGAVLWVSGTTYALGFYVRSPANARIYRKLTASSSTTIDPSADVTNYTPVFLDISSGYPTTQPSLNLDFANTKQLDPRITFVRNSTATYYDGQTSAMAEQNLLLQSQTFATTWVTSNTTLGSLITAPDGTTTGAVLTGTGTSGANVIYLSNTFQAGTYTYSVYAKAGTSNYMQLCFGTSDTTQYANFDLTSGAGVVGTKGAAVSASSITLVNGWYRCTMTTVFPSAQIFTFINIVSSASAPYYQTNSLTTSINIWGAQLEQRSSVTAYTPTTTAAITNYIPQLMTAPAGVARFDCDPITRNSLGLLIEESRTNLLTYSSDFSNAAWSNSTTIRTANTVIAPDGSLTGDTTTTVNLTYGGLNRIYYTFTATPYTYSIYVKKGNWSYFGMRIGGSYTGDSYPFVNLDTGAVNTVGVTGATITLTSVGNGWYRVVLTYTPTAGSSVLDFTLTNSSGNAATNLGDGYSGIHIWGAQLEAGSFPTSYIPTVASTVTRAADVASMTGANFSSWYNQSEGSLYAEADTITTSPYPYSMILEGGPSSSFYSLGVGGNSTTADIVARSFIGGNNESIPCTWGSNILNKLSSSYNNKSLALSAVNGSIKTLNSYSDLNVPASIFIGSRGAYGGALYLNGHIRKLSYYPVALSSSNLVALTS